MRIKRMVLVLLFALGTENIYALRLQSDEGTDQNSVAEQKPQPAKRETKGSIKQKPSVSSPGFTPSEKIKADIRFAHENVCKFAEAQKASLTDFETEIVPGLIAGQKAIPVGAAG